MNHKANAGFTPQASFRKGQFSAAGGKFEPDNAAFCCAIAIFTNGNERMVSMKIRPVDFPFFLW